jgi:hypothetical protein
VTGLALTAARQALHGVLAPLLPAGRVHLYPPGNLVAPCIWIGQPDGSLDDAFTVATYPVHIVADGAPDEQCRILDTLLEAVWVQLVPYRPTGFTPGTVDAGAGRAEELREYVVDVEVTVDARVFCPPDPVTVPAWPQGASV